MPVGWVYLEPGGSKLVIACAGIGVATRQPTAIAAHCSERRSFMMRTPSRSDISGLLFRVVKARDAGPMNSTHERFGGVNAFCLLTTHSGHDQIRREGESKSRIPRDARHLSRWRAAREPHGPAPPIPLVAIEAQLGAL